MADLTLVFDLDGTLVDTAPDLINATNHVLASLDLAPLDGALIRPAISFGGLAMIRKGLAHHAVNPPKWQMERYFEMFLDHYSANIAVGSRPFEGIETLLARYRERGARLAVCTNKREDLTRMLLSALDLTGAFDAIAGRDTFPVCKPDPQHLRGAIEMAGGDGKRAIMVGDSQTDISTAEAAGIPVIGVTFGYSDPPMEKLKPTHMISSYRDFEAAVDKVLR